MFSERKLLDSESKGILDEITEGVMLISRDFKIIWANKAALKQTGHSISEIKGVYCYRVTHNLDKPCQSPNEACPVEEVMKTGNSATVVHAHFNKTGEKLFIEISLHPVKNKKGEIVHFIHISRDITERKHGEVEMAKLRSELYHLSRIMTMNELSISLAHEINQPLGAILNNSSAAKLLMSQGPDKQGDIKEILTDIIKDAKRAGDVVRKIRGMVKKGDVNFEPLIINTLIEDVVELFYNSITINKVALRLDLQPDLAKVMGDRVHLQQVLLNLITNALEAMKECASSMLVIRSAMTGPDIVTVSVSDSGPGIDEEKKEVVFKSFFTTKKEGLGFGLAICRAIVEEHGGRILVENNPSAGATFSFSLKAWRDGSA